MPSIHWFEITKFRLEHVMNSSNRFQKRTPRRYWLILFVAGILLLPGAGPNETTGDATPKASNQDQPITKPDATTAKLKKATAAEIMQGVYDSFAWIDSTRTFRIRTKYKITHTEEAREHEAKNPDRRPYGANGKIDPRPFWDISDWAWDETRVRYHSEWKHEGEPDEVDRQSTKIWDGALGVEFSGPPDQPSHYVLGDKVSTFFSENETLMAYRPWGPGGPHNIWWLPTDVTKWRDDWGISPKDFEIVGEENLNGRRCRVLESRVGHYRMHIGADDGRLYRRTWLYVFSKDPNYSYLKLLQKIGGAAIKTTYHWQPWIDRLDPAERRRAWRELKIAQFEYTRPLFYQTFDDYREVAPGCWLPFRQTLDHYNVHVAKPFLEHQSEQIVTDVSVNQPLADDLFQIKLVDGVQVSTDWRYDPCIRYIYQKDQTEEERLALCEAERKEQAKTAEEMERRKATIKSRLGGPPIPLPETGWLVGKAVSWEELRGKIVVLHFWDVNCAPCQNELPFLQGWHENAADNDIVVIGIHRQTKDVASVLKKLDEFGSKYPIIVDTPSEKADGLGLLHEWFGTSWWPHTVLINKRGQVAGNGQLWLGDIPNQIRRLAAEE